MEVEADEVKIQEKENRAFDKRKERSPRVAVHICMHNIKWKRESMAFACPTMEGIEVFYKGRESTAAAEIAIRIMLSIAPGTS